MRSLSSITLLPCIAAFAVSCGVRAPGHTPGSISSSAPIPLEEAVSGEALHVATGETTETLKAQNPRVTSIEDFLAEKPTGLTPLEIRALAETLIEESDRHGIEPRLVLAVMYVESRFHAFAISPVGALGLMQVLPSTGREMAMRLGIEWKGPETLFDPVANTRIGVAYMKQLTRRYDELNTALAAYNWGPGAIDRRIRRGSPVPVQYPTLIMEAYSQPAMEVAIQS